MLVQITSDPATGSSKKLHPEFKGPFRISKVLINDHYEVEDLREGCRQNRTIVAADRDKVLDHDPECISGRHGVLLS